MSKFFNFCFSPGDYVFHKKYGVGQLLGIERLNIDGNISEFLKIAYDASSFIFIPIFNIDILKFHSTKENFQKLDSLDKGNQPKVFKQKLKLQENIYKIAKKLVKLSAKRELLQIESFELPENYYLLDQKCPYSLTVWQKNAFDEILQDLSKNTPMDRLLCADVGFGKTELALRSSFVVINHKYKVIFIVPTVILAKQHYALFQRRLEYFGIKCGLLCRLSKKAQLIKQSWLNGEFDLLITTQNKGIEKLLLNDVKLIILDEEHHFGAKFKEQLRNVHFLQLSATPIPRTLNLALSGIKNISTLEFPPFFLKNDEELSCDKKIHILSKQDLNLLKNAIFQEIANNGRVFLVAPRIEMISKIETIITKLTQEKYIILHSKLNTTEIAQNFEKFKNGIIKIMLSTNIIESGIDIAEANLMIIFDAHIFGIAQLHQLRGRIGRKNPANANLYLIVPESFKSEQISFSNAMKRIKSLQEHSYLGSGYNLAMQDIAIRGAGNVLGYKQSGKNNNLGLEVYYEMLAQAITDIKNNNEKPIFDVSTTEKTMPDQNSIANEIVFEGFNAYIDDCIKDESLKINFYKKIANSSSIAELEDVRQEMLGLLNELSISMQNLFDLAKIRLLSNNKIKKLIKNINGFSIYLHDQNTQKDVKIDIKSSNIDNVYQFITSYCIND